jgi:predicted nucleic-acid-binding Zn-ribbon protein
MQTEARQHSRLSSGLESLDGVESARGNETNETVAFNTNAAPKSANAPVTVSTVSFPSCAGLSQRSKDSYIGATTITVAIRSKRTVHMRVLATARAYDKSASRASPHVRLPLSGLVSKNFLRGAEITSRCDLCHSGFWIFRGNSFGREMAMLSNCTKCGSSNLIRLNAEVTFASGKKPPLYLLQKPTVCLNCGFTESSLPRKPWLR